MVTSPTISKATPIAPQMDFHSSKLSSINLNKANTILQQLKPLILPFKDAQGRIIQIWKLRQRELIGGVLDAHGGLTVVLGNRIYNPLNPQEDGIHLIQRLESIGLRSWGIAFDEQRLTLTVWPEMKAAGKYFQDYIAKGFQSSFSAMKNRVQNLKEEVLNHRHHSAYRKETKGEPLMRDGKPLLNPKTNKPYDHITEVNNAHKGVKNVIIDVKHILSRDDLQYEERKTLEGLLSETSAILDESEKMTKRPSPLMTPAKKQFDQTLQQTHLTKSYNRNHPTNPVPSRGTGGGTIGGVGNEVGILLGLFDGLSAQMETEHAFFLPAAEGGKLELTKGEIDQLLHELAVGIFVHDAVPFFSLHFNGDTNMFPVIHPAYQKLSLGT